MLLRLEVGDDRPLFRQIAAAVRAALIRGDISAGDRLPAARDLAASLDVNMHTVLRAYGILRDEGIVELRRGRGAVVVGMPGDAELAQLTRELVGAARRLDVPLPDLVERITKEFS
jgi:GntR family transcriptional regulator